MNVSELQLIQAATTTKIRVTDLKNQGDRTLLYGYTCDRLTWHLYIRNSQFFLLVYDVNTKDTPTALIQSAVEVDQDGVVPSKRLYPEACDFEFCSLLAQRGVHLPFTTYNEQRTDKQFHGEIL